MSRITLVTGAGGGIGRALAELFAKAEDTVILTGRRPEALNETQAMIRTSGGEAVIVPADVSDRDSVDSLAAAVLGRFGRIDVVINNSGVAGPSARLWEVDPDDWQETFAVNVTGVFLITRAFMPALIDGGSGSVILIGSLSGKRPLVGRSAYASSKMALVGLTRTLAHEAGPFGVRVNLISPGFVEGPRIDWVVARQAAVRGLAEEEVRSEMEALSPLGRLTQADEVAAAALWLASPAAAAITGIDLNVNCGVVMY